MIAPWVQIRQDAGLFRTAVNQTARAAFKVCSSLAYKSEPRLILLIAQEVFSMRRALTVLGLTTMLAAAAASFVVLPNGTSRAAATDNDSTFIISANDGYGL